MLTDVDFEFYIPEVPVFTPIVVDYARMAQVWKMRVSIAFGNLHPTMPIGQPLWLHLIKDTYVIIL